MFSINKISQRYNINEDRLQFAIQNDASEVVCLWVTQKIANLLARVLLDHLDKYCSQHNDPKVINLETSKKEASAVSFESAKESGLVHTFNLTFKQDKAEIVFRWAITGCASVTFDEKQLKDFCRGLASLFEVASWSREVFPKDLIVTQEVKESSFEDFDEALETILTTKSLH